MTISVLIPAYRAGELIGNALESLRRQTLVDWELVVIKDGSHDKTEQLIAAFSGSVTQSVRYYNLGVNRGISIARNQAGTRATGDLVAFLDADDYWDDHNLEAAAKQIALGADFVVSTIRIFDFASGAEPYRRRPPEDLVNEPISALITNSFIVTSSSVVLKPSLCKNVGTFDGPLLIGEDRDYWLRCALKGARFARSLFALARYAKHSGGTLNKIQLWAKDNVKFQLKYHDLPRVSAPIRRRALGDASENHGRLLHRNNPGKSTTRPIEAWRLAPWKLKRLVHAGYSLLCFFRFSPAS